MDTLQELLNLIEVVGKKIAELKQKLAEARAEGKTLFTEFQKRQGDLAGRFGFSGAVTAERQKGTRAAFHRRQYRGRRVARGDQRLSGR